MSNPNTQAIVDPQNDLPPRSPGGTAPMVPARSAGDGAGLQRLWSRTRFSAAAAGRAFGHHHPVARAYSDVSTQL